MDIQLVRIVLHILDSVSMISWTGSIVFFLIVIRPVLSSLNEDGRISVISALFKNISRYLRAWGILTVALSLATILIYVRTFQEFLVVFDPLKTLLWVIIMVVAYFVAGEGYLFKFLHRYISISKTIDEKTKGKSVAHLLVIEKRVPGYMLLQLSLLLAVLVIYTYFPINYPLP